MGYRRRDVPVCVHIIAAARPNFMKVAPLYHALAVADDFEPGPDFDEEDVQGVDPLVMRFPAGAIDAPPGYEVVDAWGIY